MFVEIKVRQNIMIEPTRFTDDKNYGVKGSNDFSAEIVHKIQSMYANRVIPQQGFCVSLSQIDSVGKAADIVESEKNHYDCSILDSVETEKNGSAYFNVTFRLIMFRPYKQEILTGYVRKVDQTGVALSLELFPGGFWAV